MYTLPHLLTDMHLVRIVQLLELDVLEIVGHSKVHDQVHGLLGNDSRSDLDKRVLPERRRMHSPASDAACLPRNVSVFTVIGRAVPFHAVLVEVAARILVDVIANPGQRTGGLLKVSTTVAVPLRDVGVVLLVVGRRVEWPV